MIISSQSNVSLVINSDNGRSVIINSIAGGSSSGSGSRVTSQAFDITAGSTQTIFTVTDHTPTDILLVYVNGNTVPPSDYTAAVPDVEFNSAPGLDYPDNDFQVVILYSYNA